MTNDFETAHPRVSGENYPHCATETSERGSSPRERGKRLKKAEKAFFEGLIPA